MLPLSWMEEDRLDGGRRTRMLLDNLCMPSQQSVQDALLSFESEAKFEIICGRELSNDHAQETAGLVQARHQHDYYAP